MEKEKNIVKNIMYFISLPFIIIALIALIVCVIMYLINGFKETYVLVCGVIIGISLLISVTSYLILSPFSKRIDKENYSKVTSQNFDEYENTDNIAKIYPVIGFNELCQIQSDGLFFKGIKKLVKYSDVTISIYNRRFYGQIDNYFMIKIDTKKYKNFPNYVYLVYSKSLMYLFKSYNVCINDLDKLQSKKEKVKDEVLKTYRYPIKYLLIKIAITVALIVAGTLSILFSDSDYLGYVFYFPILIVWMNNSKSGKVCLTNHSLYLYQHFVKVEMEYREIIKIDVEDKKIKISSPFTFIEFYYDENMIEEIKKHL